jgi:flagellar basal body-associated protein FliL
MKKYRKKLLAPILITVLTLLLLACYLAVFLFFPDSGLPIAARIVPGVILVALAGVSISMLAERIREIRSGEEDDLSKY